MNKEEIRRLYIDEELTQEEIADELSVTQAAVSYHMKDMDIDTNDKTTRPPPVLHTELGYEYWQHHDGESKKSVYIHRLLSISEYGFEKTIDKEVHHKNRIPWDNRPENIEPLSTSEHRRRHKGGIHE